MANLQTKDFTKNASAGDYAGKDRHSIVLFKIKDKKPFVLSATQTGPKVYGVTYDKTKKILVYKDTLASKKLKEISILKVFKDKDFGGGASGSGGGADLTRIAESAQCYYNSYAFNVAGKELKKPPTLKELGTSARYVQADMNLYDAMDKCPEDWHDVFVKTANVLVKTYRNKVSGNVYFHRGSPFMDAIYDNKKQAQKWDKENNVVTLAPGSFSDDKWNPGDIWMSTLKPDSEEPFEGTPLEWVTLREAVFDSAKKAKCLGVSLKKVESGAAKVVEFNLPKRKHNVSVTFKGYVFGQTGDFFNSADVYLHFSTGIMQCRATATTSSWQGEMKGKFAAMGKIGGGNLNYYTELFFKNSIASTSIEKNWKEISYADGDLNNMYELYKRFINNQMLGIKTQKVVSKAEFKKSADNYINPKGKKASEAFYFGKYMCLLFLESINAYKKGAKLNKLSTEIVRYAQSNTDISSYFVKVS